MDIVVCIKRTVDTAAQVTIGSEDQVVCEGASFIINPLDEYALEAAVRLKESQGGSVCAVTLGGEETVESLRVAFAMGADRLVRVDDGGAGDSDELRVAAILAKAVARFGPDVVIMGRVSSDNASGQVPHRVAEALGMPVLDGLMELSAQDGRVRALRAAAGGAERVEAETPVLVCAQKGLNEPRFASFAGLMKAKKAPVEVLTLDDLGLSVQDAALGREVVSRRLPASKGATKVVEGDPVVAAAALAALLRDEAKAL